jgi:hypothetical protein
MSARLVRSTLPPASRLIDHPKPPRPRRLIRRRPPTAIERHRASLYPAVGSPDWIALQEDPYRRGAVAGDYRIARPAHRDEG